MTDLNPRYQDSAELRKNAEEKTRAAEAALEGALPPTPDEVKRAIHELRVHQIELEMQNEELLRTQAQLEVARARYFDLFNLAPAGYLTLNEHGIILEANLTASTLLGMPRGEIRNKPLSRFFHAESQDLYYQFFRMVIDSGMPQGCELQLKKDVPAWVSLEASSAQAHGSEPEYSVIMIDITRRKIAEGYRNLSSEIMGILNDLLSWPDAMSGVLAAIKRNTGFDAVGIRLKKGEDFPYFAHDGFSEKFLLKENTLINRSRTYGVCRDDNDAMSLACSCGLVLAGKTDPANPLFTKGGSLWTNNSLRILDISPDRDPRLNPRNTCIHHGFLSIALIPIRANREIVGLLQLNDLKKDRLTSDMLSFFEGICDSIGIALMRKSMEDDLALANKDLEAFGYSVAHDLRNPLNSIITCRSVIADDRESVLGKDAQKALEYIQHDTKRMTDVISDLLAFSKIQRHQISRTKINLSDLARNIWTILITSNPNRVADFILEPHITVHADGGLMQLLLENIIHNAWKFTGKKKQARVEFGTLRKMGRIVYFIRDNGAGFDMALAPQLFKPFVRLHDNKDFRGTGIGLAIARRIVEKHNGAIWVEAEPDSGATFYFTLDSESRRGGVWGEPIVNKPCSAIIFGDAPQSASPPKNPSKK
jgi:PAS domain S-box-containing protein